MEFFTLILHAYTCGEPINVWQALKNKNKSIKSHTHGDVESFCCWPVRITRLGYLYDVLFSCSTSKTPAEEMKRFMCLVCNEKANIEIWLYSSNDVLGHNFRNLSKRFLDSVHLSTYIYNLQKPTSEPNYRWSVFRFDTLPPRNNQCVLIKFFSVLLNFKSFILLTYGWN